jgi:long-chain acyl-CoA synthetase
MRWAHIQRAALSGYGPDTVALIATPLYSNTTLVCGDPGAGLWRLRGADAEVRCRAYLQQAQQHRATHTMLVPVQYQRLMAHPDFDRYDLSSSSQVQHQRAFPRRAERPTCCSAGRAD